LRHRRGGKRELGYVFGGPKRRNATKSRPFPLGLKGFPEARKKFMDTGRRSFGGEVKRQSLKGHDVG